MDARRKYRARPASCQADMEAALALRGDVFRSGGSDRDAYDGRSTHMLVERLADGAIVATFRYLLISDPQALDESYSAQFYGLAPLGNFDGPMVEMGRFCFRPGVSDPDLFRVAWGSLAQIVVEERAELLFGCSSFAGVDTAPYHDAFAMLRDRHIAPKTWLPRIKAPRVFEFARRLGQKADPKRAMRAMPPLLKTYLMMGGWVSDHAVVDADLGTLHVFTGVEVRAIPPARRRSLLAGV
ncbi:MAG: GNAT family N-acyltransferase [Pseudomonadota bacterium]